MEQTVTSGIHAKDVEQMHLGNSTTKKDTKMIYDMRQTR